jgi:hypothetical protein
MMVWSMALKPATLNVAPGATASLTDFSSVILPSDIGQSAIQVYSKSTKHSIRGLMLDYWRALGADNVYGNPVSEPFASPTGYYSQAFENAVFEYHPEFEGTNDPLVRMAPIGSALIGKRVEGLRRDKRREMGGGDRRSSIWAALDPKSDAVKRAKDDGGFYSDVSGHTVAGDFADWYTAHEGGFYLGEPLSQAFKEAGTTIQYFECGALIRRNDVVRLAPLGARGAEALGVDLSPIAQDDLPEFAESLFKTAENPDPVGDITTPGRKWVEVNISQERLWAYQGDTVVMTTLVSTGLAPNNTERGTFHIRMKFEKQTMSGFASSTGEVVGLGDNPVAGATHWEVKDVPNVMYVNTDAEALHGAYWHNNFGQPMSHGCINLPLDVASWMYGWTPLGTMVWVHD